MDNKKILNNALLKEASGNNLKLIIKDGSINGNKIADSAIKTNHIDNRAVTGDKVDDETIDYNHLTPNLKSIIETTGSGTTTISQELGDNEKMTISQKVITESINRIWQKIEDITGESYKGITMFVNPLYYFGNNGCDVQVVATSEGNQGPFEKLEFYTNGVKRVEVKNVDYYSGSFHIEGDTEIMCKAKVRGEQGSDLYEKRANVKRYDSFYICAADATDPDFTNIINNPNYTIALNESRRYSKDVAFSVTGQKLYIIMDPIYDIIRADMNGFEIPVVESSRIIQNKEYRVYTSENQYQAGTYNIDING